MGEAPIKKFLVVKDEDIEKHLNSFDKKELSRLMGKIAKGRAMEGKNEDNFYLVINQDEPYAFKIKEIMQRHGHWG